MGHNPCCRARRCGHGLSRRHPFGGARRRTADPPSLWLLGPRPLPISYPPGQPLRPGFPDQTLHRHGLHDPGGGRACDVGNQSGPGAAGVRRGAPHRHHRRSPEPPAHSAGPGLCRPIRGCGRHHLSSPPHPHQRPARLDTPLPARTPARSRAHAGSGVAGSPVRPYQRHLDRYALCLSDGQTVGLQRFGPDPAGRGRGPAGRHASGTLFGPSDL